MLFVICVQGQCRSTFGRLLPSGRKKPNAESSLYAEVQSDFADES